MRIPESIAVGKPFLGFDFGWCNRLRWKLEHGRFLTLQQVIQQHHLPIGKFQRIVMNVWIVLVHLPKDGRGVREHLWLPAEQPAACAEPYWTGEGKFCPGRTQTAVLASSGAANPRVPVLKCCVLSFSPTFAGRDFTCCRL